MDPWSVSFVWRIDNFSKLARSEPVTSDCFEAGICTWRLRVWPKGCEDGGTHLAAFLEAQDEMWAASATYKFTVVHQVDASKSISGGVNTNKFRPGETASWGVLQLIDLSMGWLAGLAGWQRDGWVVNDKLVLRVDVTVEREDRFTLDAGMPSDVALKLPCGAEVPVHAQLLQLASPFFRAALEDVKGSALIPVDGSLGAWTYVLMDLYPLHDPPALTWGSVFTLLPVAHKYDFPRLLARLVAFVKDNSDALTHDSKLKAYSIRWLALAERLQLDELRELVLGKVRGMTREQLQQAIAVEVEAGGSAAKQKVHAVREEVKQLGAARDALFVIAAFAS
ncbi:hypothetical protein FOA52_014311 [Chlamydomonas sp. UWO 241]|nr:hypothetical protein FOA52_014311 [Chlamydomonas sp. UWO 241]